MSANTVAGPADRLLVMGLLKGTWLAQACAAAVRLGVFDSLAEGSRKINDLADEIGVPHDRLYRVLRALTTVDLLVEDIDRRFTLAPAGQLLLSAAPGSLREVALRCGEDLYELFADLPEVIRSGRSAVELTKGASYYEQDSGENIPDLGVPSTMNKVNLPNHGVVADLGGGGGAVLEALLAERPGLRGVLFERERVMHLAQKSLARRLVANRVEVVGGDFFVEVPAANIYVLSRCLRNWADDAALRLLRNVQSAAVRGSRLLIIERVLPDGPVFHPAKVDDLLSLVLTEGRERSEDEFRDLLRKAGFELKKIHCDLVNPHVECVLDAVMDT